MIKKKELELQLNGDLPIEEIPKESDLKRMENFKHLNEIGIWYDKGKRRIVKFPKSEEFWKDAGGKDGSRGIDDWASK